MMRQTVLALALACTIGAAAAQVGAPPPPPPVAAAPVSVNGSVERFMLNPNGDIDGLWLRDGTQVGFPPHLSSEVKTAVRAGDSVVVQGFRLGNLPVLQASSIRSSRSGREVVDRPPTFGAPPPPPPTPGQLTPLQSHGTIQRLVYGPAGEVHGALVSDGSVVRMPPHRALQFTDLLRVGAPLSANGFGVATADGRAIEATQLGRDRASLRALFTAPRPDGPLPPPGAPVPPAVR
ncbi:hypothetical protein ACCQ05_20510 [Xanthomonas sp. NCPPB 3582]|uniref:hypothetical protein n=1 Tax=Xanthomonas sp. NCPPB 3582 TaxID=487557 RepID=UPI0035566D74